MTYKAFATVEEANNYWIRKFDQQSRCIMLYQHAILNIALNSENQDEIKLILKHLRDSLMELGVKKDEAYFTVPDIA